MALLWLVPLLFSTGFVAGFIDSIAGGGGLISLPVLLSVGMAPQDALGTNKLQATFGSLSAARHYARAGLVNIRDCRAGIGFTTAGAILGTLLVQWLPADWLRLAIPILLIAIALYNLFQPKLGAEDIHPRLNPGVFSAVFGLTLGFYDGFFGPGTGTFWAMAYLVGLGFNLTKATAYTKVMNSTSNVASLAVFLAGHRIHYTAGLVMGVGQLVGARMGSGRVLKHGTQFIRPVFITMVLALAVKLVYQNCTRP
jgi:uncharacterized membrane protein YfcA